MFCLSTIGLGTGLCVLYSGLCALTLGSGLRTGALSQILECLVQSKDHTVQSHSTVHRAQNPDPESETVPRTRALSTEPKAQIAEHRANSTVNRQELRAKSQRAGCRSQSTEPGPENRDGVESPDTEY